MNPWNLFYRVLVSTSFDKSFCVFLGSAIFSQTFKKRPTSNNTLECGNFSNITALQVV
jgi:hypothetical protein